MVYGRREMVRPALMCCVVRSVWYILVERNDNTVRTPRERERMTRTYTWVIPFALCEIRPS